MGRVPSQTLGPFSLSSVQQMLAFLPALERGDFRDAAAQYLRTGQNPPRVEELCDAVQSSGFAVPLPLVGWDGRRELRAVETADLVTVRMLMSDFASADRLCGGLMAGLCADGSIERVLRRLSVLAANLPPTGTPERSIVLDYAGPRPRPAMQGGPTRPAAWYIALWGSGFAVFSLIFFPPLVGSGISRQNPQAAAAGCLLWLASVIYVCLRVRDDHPRHPLLGAMLSFCGTVLLILVPLQIRALSGDPGHPLPRFRPALLWPAPIAAAALLGATVTRLLHLRLRNLTPPTPTRTREKAQR